MFSLVTLIVTFQPRVALRSLPKKKMASQVQKTWIGVAEDSPLAP
jgi:hypothetical protein